MTYHDHELGPLEREPVNLRPPFEIRVPLHDRSPRRLTGPDIPFETWRAAQLADRVAALREPLAGLALGGHDRSILDWIAGFDVPTIGGVASLLHRARAAAPRITRDPR
jgi:hypothetical protein